MKILILAKTKMNSNRVCVGGIDIDTNRLVRLINPGGNAILNTTNFEIGDIWEINCEDRQDIIAPHVEDVIIGKRAKVDKVDDIEEYIKSRDIKVWEGNITNIFDGKLGWTSGNNGYISSRNIPTNSVGFWISDKDLFYKNGKYVYKGSLFFISDKQLSYKGHQNPIAVIPKGTLIRVSLARWWKPNDVDIEERCYLQLSGWYD